MIAVTPQASTKTPTTSSRSEAATITNEEKTSSARDIPGLHEGTKQHPEVSKFTQITDTKKIEDLPGATDIANFYKIGSEKPQAELFHCKDRNHMVAILKGQDAYEQLFKGGAYTVFGMGRFFGGFSKNIGKQWINSAINLMNHADQKIKYPQLKAELQSGELRVVAIYEQDAKTGKYSKEPKAIAILDKAKQMINDIEKGMPKNNKDTDRLKELLEEAKHDTHLQNLYQCSLLITNPKAKEHLSKKEYLVKTATLIAETCPKEWQILFPMKLFNDGTEDQSKAKDYQSLNWLHPVKKDGKWTHEKGEVTLARARENSQEPISELLAFVNNWHALHEVDASIKLTADDDKNLAEIYQQNQTSIRDYNNKTKAPGTEKP